MINSELDGGDEVIGVFLDIIKLLTIDGMKVCFANSGQWGLGKDVWYFQILLRQSQRFVSIKGCKSSQLFLKAGVANNLYQ